MQYILTKDEYDALMLKSVHENLINNIKIVIRNLSAKGVIPCPHFAKEGEHLKYCDCCLKNEFYKICPLDKNWSK